MLGMLLVLSVAQDVDFERELAGYRQQTRARVECNSDADEIVVCARREADLYRSPLLASHTGERDNIGAFEARELLLRQRNACETKIGATPYGCGFFGATMSTGARGTRFVERPTAP